MDIEQSKLTERRVPLTMPANELAALDAYCSYLRRATGDAIGRNEVIRQAIRDKIGRQQQEDRGT